MQPITLFLALLFFSCGQKARHGASTFPYDLSAPDKTYLMPKPLKEISGISFLSDNILACIEDNHGIIYLYDLDKEKITDEISFGEKGDYEDIAVVGKAYWVIRSDGNLFKTEGSKSINYQTPLNSDNNIEGLCSDKSNNTLLLACKDEPGSGISNDKKSVYKFDLSSNKLEATPLFAISIDSIIQIGQNGNYESDEKHFSPSAIAIHPKTGNLFIISSRGNILVETDRKGNIIHVEKIYNKIFHQPEGICFNDEGDLFISNEGKDHEHGNILRFKQK